MEVKWGFKNSLVLPTLTYTSETWTQNETQQAGIYAINMRKASGLTRWDDMSNEEMYNQALYFLRIWVTHCIAKYKTAENTTPTRMY